VNNTENSSSQPTTLALSPTAIPTIEVIPPSIVIDATESPTEIDSITDPVREADTPQPPTLSDDDSVILSAFLSDLFSDNIGATAVLGASALCFVCLLMRYCRGSPRVPVAEEYVRLPVTADDDDFPVSPRGKRSAPPVNNNDAYDDAEWGKLDVGTGAGLPSPRPRMTTNTFGDRIGMPPPPINLSASPRYYSPSSPKMSTSPSSSQENGRLRRMNSGSRSTDTKLATDEDIFAVSIRILYA
jgi:hypothetical protein